MESRIENKVLLFGIAGIVVLIFGTSILRFGFTVLFKIAKSLIRSIFIY